MSSYKEELVKAMTLLADKGYLFFGQCVRYGGTSLYHTIKHVPENQRMEFIVQEEVQMGMSAGMALEGLKVCSIYPRWDFMILGMNQLINHLDKVRRMSDNQFKLKGLIIRVAVGSVKPLFPGEQHCGDYSDAVKLMCKDIQVIKLQNPEDVYPAYEKAIESDAPTILVEYPDLYNSEFRQDFIESRRGVK